MRREESLSRVAPRAEAAWFLLLFFVFFAPLRVEAKTGTGAGEGAGPESDAARLAASADRTAEIAGDWILWREEAGGRVRRAAPLRADRAPNKGRSAATASSEILLDLAPLVGLQPVLDELSVLLVKRGVASEHVLFARNVDGITVEPGRIGVHFGRDGRLLSVDLGIDPRLVAGEKAAAIDADEAVRIATGGTGAPEVTEATRIYREGERELRAAWRVRYFDAAEAGLWEAEIDAVTGAILRRENRSMRLDGSGRIWSPNPVSVLEDTNLRDMNDTDQAVFDPAYRIETLRDLVDPAGGTVKLEGPFVRIVDFENPSVPPPERSDPEDFLATRGDDSFEAVMAYFHLDRVQRYLRGLGYDGVGADSIVATPIPVDVHAFSGDDNSRYDPPPLHRLAFGDGCVDDAEDADVLTHEYGHAIEFSQVPDWGYPSGYMGAMAEGFSDYWAESHAARSGVVFDLGQVFDWDKNRREPACRWAGRRTDNGAVVPDSLYPLTSGNIYLNSRIWSGSLWDIHQAIGGDASDRAILESHFYLDGTAPNSTFEDGALAVLQAEIELTGGTHAFEIFDAFRDRGILTDESIGQTELLFASHPETLFAAALPCTLGLHSPVPIGRVEVLYGSEAADEESLALEPAGEGLFTGAIPIATGPDSIFYVYRAIDVLHRTKESPVAGAYRTYVAADTEPPHIAHEPRSDLFDDELPATVQAVITDNLAVDIDSVWVDFEFDATGGGSSWGRFSLASVPPDSHFAGTFPEGTGRIGTYTYSIVAVDESPLRNHGRSPATGSYSFSVLLDTAPPVVRHTPPPGLSEEELPAAVSVVVLDNTRVDSDSVWIDYVFSGFRGESVSGTIHLEATEIDTVFAGVFPEGPGRLGTYFYRITAVDSSSRRNRSVSPPSGMYTFRVGPSSSGVTLRGPNPFATEVAFELALARDSEVRLFIYDISGRLVRRVSDGRLERGIQTLVWDGKTEEGRRAAPGTYLYRLEAAGIEKSGAVVLLR